MKTISKPIPVQKTTDAPFGARVRSADTSHESAAVGSSQSIDHASRLVAIQVAHDIEAMHQKANKSARVPHWIPHPVFNAVRAHSLNVFGQLTVSKPI